MTLLGASTLAVGEVGSGILVAGLLLAAGLGASLLAGRLRVPALVLFLGLGMLVGSDGIGAIDFNDYELARTIGVIALALILFEGGLAAGWADVRPVLGPALSLAIVGTLITAAVAGLVAAALFDISTKEGFLLGAILASTDGAAIFGLMRGASLRPRLTRTLEGEAGFNDPVAVMLVIAAIAWINQPGYDLLDATWLAVRQLGVGAVVGITAGLVATQLVPRVRLSTEGLYPVASLATAALAFGAADVLDGSGFLAVYLVGLFLNGVPMPARSSVHAFHGGLAWLAQLAMFLVLGLLVFPSRLDDVILEGTVLALVVPLVARPLATFVSTIGFGFSRGERVVLGWAGLRGAVPVVLATFPVIEHVPGSVEFFNIVFFAVLLSTLLQGATFEALAARLNVTVIPGHRTPGPRPIVRGVAQIFSVRPWSEADGDPSNPRTVNGRRVSVVLRVRLDVGGALVVLEDGVFAVTGPLVAMGGRGLLSDWARRRIRAGSSDPERRWMEDVLGALAL